MPGTALAAVWLVNVWQNTPYVALILLAGLRSLPSEPLEAASIDGATRPQMFRYVTLPLLRPYLLVALLLRTIFEFRAFDNIYALTGGGPANATMVLSMFTYLASFVRFDFSLGAAASWVMLVMSMLMCLFFIAVIRRREGVLMAAVVGSRRTRQLQAALIYLALIVLSIAFLFPLIWVLGLSLKTRLQVFATPPLFIWWPTFGELRRVFSRADFVHAFSQHA
jgi:ABC-type sugar transport system permease subunit